MKLRLLVVWDLPDYQNTFKTQYENIAFQKKTNQAHASKYEMHVDKLENDLQNKEQKV